VAIHELLAGGHLYFLCPVPMSCSPWFLCFLGGLGRSLLFHVTGGVRLLCGGCGRVKHIACRLSYVVQAKARSWVPILRYHAQGVLRRAWQASFSDDLLQVCHWRSTWSALSSPSCYRHGFLEFPLSLAPRLRRIPGRPISQFPSSSRHGRIPVKYMNAVIACQITPEEWRGCRVWPLCQ
jgi:hypothetical protein